MAKKQDGSVPTTTAPQTKNSGNTAESRQVEYVVVDGKLVPDTHPGVVR